MTPRHGPAAALAAVVRRHARQPLPDPAGRVGVCSCGWWQPGTTWGRHLADQLSAAGVHLTTAAQLEEPA